MNFLALIKYKRDDGDHERTDRNSAILISNAVH